MTILNYQFRHINYQKISLQYKIMRLLWRL